MAKEKAEEQPKSDAAKKTDAPKKSGKLKFMILIGMLVVVLGSGAVVGKIMLPHGKQGRPEPVKEEVDAKVMLDDFTLNLGGNVDHYLKATVGLGCMKGITAESVTENVAPIRDTVNSVLISKSFQDLASESGRDEAKAEIKEKLNKELGKTVVVKVYFTNFTMQ